MQPHPAHDSGRITALDGCRGIAILLVLGDHIQGQWFNGYFPGLHTGQHGVTFFFVLSGYLITESLLQSNNLKVFYIRRFFRLMPVAWSYLAFLWLLGIAFPLKALPPIDLYSCLLFFRNYVHTQSGLLPTVHFWSLSIEEQFYIVWPAILIFAGRRKSVIVATAVALACAAVRVANWDYYNHSDLAFHTEVRADALCIGCLLAIALRDPRLCQAAIRWLPRLQIPALVIFLSCAATFESLPPMTECLAIATLICLLLVKPESVLSKSISLPPLVFVGRISYSLYVWQQFFVVSYGPSTNMVLDLTAPLVAIGVYFLIEKPFTDLGRWITSAHRRQDAPGPHTTFAR